MAEGRRTQQSGLWTAPTRLRAAAARSVLAFLVHSWLYQLSNVSIVVFVYEPQASVACVGRVLLPHSLRVTL